MQFTYEVQWATIAATSSHIKSYVIKGEAVSTLNTLQAKKVSASTAVTHYNQRREQTNVSQENIIIYLECNSEHKARSDMAEREREKVASE